MLGLNSDIKALIAQGDYLFGNRSTLMSLWQEAAENFYPQRADFTSSRVMGNTYADNLTTSAPLLAQRDLGNAIGGLIRPKNKMWGKVSVADVEEVDTAGRQWLERASLRQYNVLYNRDVQFTRATKEADHDFVLFGQAVLQKTLNSKADNLLFKTHHLRDVAWCENNDNKVDTVHRKWPAMAIDLCRMFPDKVSPKVKKLAEKEPYKKIQCRHIVVPNDGYGYKPSRKIKQPFVSIIIDVENNTILEEIGSWDIQYIIPRWQTVSGSQYAYSPALVVALPDSRLIQDITLTLLEAGEKAANPPLIATQNAVAGEVNVFAGGVTWADSAYDERLGEVLRPISQNYAGLPMAVDLQRDVRSMISAAFFLDKISLPMMSGERTALEMSQRIEDYIRNALPLFEPLEQDYNGAIYEMTFNDLLRRGVFGTIDEMPDSLSGKEIKFQFESPLTQALGAEKGQKFIQNRDLLLAAAELDPRAKNLMNVKAAVKDVMITSSPASWMNTEEDIEAMEQAAVEQEMLQKGVQMAQQGGQGFEATARGIKTLGEAGVM